MGIIEDLQRKVYINLQSCNSQKERIDSIEAHCKEQIRLLNERVNDLFTKQTPDAPPMEVPKVHRDPTGGIGYERIGRMVMNMPVSGCLRHTNLNDWVYDDESDSFSEEYCAETAFEALKAGGVKE